MDTTHLRVFIGCIPNLVVTSPKHKDDPCEKGGGVILRGHLGVTLGLK